MRGATRWMRRLVPGAGLAALALTAVGVGSGPVALSGSQTTLYPLVVQTFTGNSVGQDWTLPANPPTFGAANAACLTEGGTPTSTSAIPQCQGASDTGDTGSLRLTTNTSLQLGTVFFANSVPTQRGLVVRFDTYQYNAGCAPSGETAGVFAGGQCQGADGIGFILAAANPADPQPPSTGGNLGGALGYGPLPKDGYSSTEPTSPLPGIPGGYLGVGLDVYGNYLNPQYNLGTQANWDSNTSNASTPCALTSPLPPETFPEEVTVKGPGNDLTGYCPIVSTYSSSNAGSGFMLDQPFATTRPTTPVQVEVALNPGASSVSIAGLDSTTLSVPAGDFLVQFLPYAYDASPQTLEGTLPQLTQANNYEGVPQSWVDPSTGLPYQLTFGFTGSTGGAVEVHEITNVTAETISAKAPTLGLNVTDNTNHVMTVGIPTTFTFTPSVAASGGTESDALSLTGTFPSGITPDLAAASGMGWTCAAGASTGSFTCTYATPSAGIQPGASATPLAIPATASAPSSTSLVVSAKVSSDDALAASGQDAVTVVAAPVTKPEAPVTPPVTTSPSSTVPSPTTKPASVPATHTGEPWAGGTLWDAVLATMIGGGTALVALGRRRRATERP